MKETRKELIVEEKETVSVGICVALAIFFAVPPSAAVY